jgi:hypothetical protein
MAWVKLDDKMWSHPKFGELTGDAVRLWVFALCWCNQHETDGAVPRGALRVLVGTEKLAQALCKAGLWRETETGWQVHDFLAYQPSKASRDANRAQVAERVAKARKNKRATKPLHEESNAHVTALHDAVYRKGNDCPVPDPDPDLSFGEIDPPLPPVGGTTTEPDSEPKRKRGRKGKPPDDWQPTDAHRAIASERGVDFALELAKFRDHEFATPRSDYDAAFRNWLRGATPQRRSGSAPRIGEPGWRRQPDGGINLDDYMTLPPPREATNG